MRKTELVFISSPGIGHLVSTVEIAKLLVDRDEQLSITVLIMKLPFDTKVDNYIKTLSTSPTPGIKFLELPQEEFHSKSRNTFFFKFIDSYKAKVREILAEISNSSVSTKLAGLVLDMFCTSMISVANEFGVPSYVFYTSGAAQLGLVLYLQSLRDDFNRDITDYKNSDVELPVPTYINPVPAKLLPSITFDKEGGCKMFLNLTKSYREAKGIIINSFLELESYAVQALQKDKAIPPIYTAGPVLNFKDSNRENEEAYQMIMKWLDLQPNSSVVFLCFGSKGYFDEDQVKEIAYALERGKHRFIWSLRRPPGKGEIGFPSEYENPEEALPKGFLQRNAGTGKVVGWTSQIAILSHPAVGGFVSHCGWNSILESIYFGVPMAAWPLYAEQQTNAFQMVKDMGIAVEIKMDYRKDFRMSTTDVVSADVIEDRIRKLMDPENGIREKLKEMKEKGRLALKEEGSSSASLKCFLDDVKNNIP